MIPVLETIQTLQRQGTTEVSRLPLQNTIFLQLLAFLAQHPSAFTSRCRTDKAGRGALEPPPEDGARMKRFDREFQFRESHTEAISYAVGFFSRKRPFSTEAQIGLSYEIEKGLFRLNFFRLRIPTGGSSRKLDFFDWILEKLSRKSFTRIF